MNPFVKASLLKEKLPGYFVARAHALNHQTLQHIAAHHREKFLKVFKYIQGNTITGVQISQGVVSCKHDGISAYFFWEKGQDPIVFHASSFGVEVGLPAAKALAAALEKAGHTSALLVAELAVGGRRSHSHEVIHLINSPQSQAEIESLHLVLFDVILLDKQEKQNLGYDERVKVLQMLPRTGAAYPATFHFVKSLDEANAFYKGLIAAGEEGMVLYDLSAGVSYKAKPLFNCDLAIVGFVEGTEELTGHAVSIMGALVEGDRYQLVARVGVADPALRVPLFEELKRNRVASTYTSTDSESRPIVWVRPTKVMEINAEDTCWEQSDGKPNTNAVLKLTAEGFAYQGQGQIIKPFHPTLARLRDDKTVNECGFKQIADTGLRLKQAPISKAPSIFCREVYTKAIKGQPAVKKIVAWEQEVPGYPNFVVHTVDFSAGRGEALKEDTRVTDDKQEAAQFIDTWRAEEIAKGWTKAA